MPAHTEAESAWGSQEPHQVSSADLVTVSSFKHAVHVMSTKTRPKRIGIVGSDGRTYTFLLKVRLATAIIKAEHADLLDLPAVSSYSTINLPVCNCFQSSP